MTRPKVKVGVVLPTYRRLASAANIARAATLSESFGFDSVWVTDHIVLPESRQARVEAFFVTREHSATFRAAPGARALRPGPRTQLSGLVLAGAFTDTGWPATMEGAVRSGLAAARQVLPALAATNGGGHGTRSPELAVSLT